MALKEGLFRDVKGRIQSYNKTTPEKQISIYKGETPKKEIPVFKNIDLVMERTKENKIEKKQVIKYTDENGREKSEFDYNRFLKEKAEDNPEFLINRTYNKFGVLADINNAFLSDTPVFYEGKQITPSNYIDVTNKIREKIKGSDSKKNGYGIFSANIYDSKMEIIFEGYEGINDESEDDE